MLYSSTVATVPLLLLEKAGLPSFVGERCTVTANSPINYTLSLTLFRARNIQFNQSSNPKLTGEG